MIFVDSNIPMYLVGGPHANRDRATAFLRQSPAEQLVTSAEVYQEVIHRYVSIDRREAIADAFRVLDDLVVTVFPVTRSDVGLAEGLVATHPGLSSRDCLHLAVMRGRGVRRALTFDQGFARHTDIAVLP